MLVIRTTFKKFCSRDESMHLFTQAVDSQVTSIVVGT